MRDYLIFAIVFGSLPFALKRPVIGLLVYVWISLMNPHRLAYGSAYDFPFAAIVAAVTLISLFLTSEHKRLPFAPAMVAMVLFLAWMTMTGFAAFNSSLAWHGWNNVVKTVVMALIAMLVINQEKDIKALALVMALSLGFYGLKGGIFTLTSGGGSRVVGPVGTYISDNNTLALGMIVALPLIWYFQTLATNKWIRSVIIGLTLLTLIAIIGSYSRGALLGGVAMLFFLWLKSRQKLMSSIAIIIVALVTLNFMPEQWFERMNTIDDYQHDASAMGRINGWQFAINVASANFMGGGFNSFTPEMFYVYAPVPTDFHVAHSIYFQVLGDHGFVGLALFLLLMFLAWRTGSRVKKYCKEKPELKWAADLAMMCQVSLVGYAVTGAFLSMPYYDFYYYVVALLVLLEKVIKDIAPNNENQKTVASLPAVRKRRLRRDFV